MLQLRDSLTTTATFVTNDTSCAPSTSPVVATSRTYQLVLLRRLLSSSLQCATDTSKGIAMASAMLSARATPSILSRLSAPTIFSSRYASVHIKQLALPLLPRLSLPLPAISLNLPSLPSLEEIWDGLLKAVPKKKMSHSRRRHRQMAGKALKDVTELCRCPACGNVKRMHFLCPTCAPKYANMMATLFSAPMPKKTIKSSESKTSEVTTGYSASAPTRTEVPIDVAQTQSKGEGVAVDKKDRPEP